MPVLGRLRSYAARASFAATLALLARRNLPLPQMLALAAGTANHAATRKHIQLVVGERASLWGPPREIILDTFRTDIQ